MTDILVTVVELVVGLALGWFVADALILRQARRMLRARLRELELDMREVYAALIDNDPVRVRRIIGSALFGIDI